MDKFQSIFILVLFNFFLFNSLNSQLVAYQDIFRGGVVGSGVSVGVGSFGNYNFEVYIEPNSTIRKAFLICQRYQSPAPTLISLNGVPYTLDMSSEVTNYMILNNSHTSKSGVHLIDITQDVIPNQLNYTLTVNSPSPLFAETFFGVVYLLILYENPLLDIVCTNIILNNQDLENNNNKFYNVLNCNPINTNYPVGFAINTDRLGSLLLNDGSSIYFNSNYLGVVAYQDLNSGIGGGVKGNFFYQNNQLYGLDDDVPNNFMDSTDGLADVSPHLVNNSTSYNFNLQWQDLNATTRYNIYISFFLTYSTPCDTFSVDIPDLIQVCKGDSVQINVSGGSTYEWEATNASALSALSCTNCPNPYFTDTVSRWYTVRVWNNDSCSKVLPVRVEVVDKPQNPIVSTSPTKCSDSSGVANVQIIASSYLYALDYGTFQSNAVFSQLSAGNHNISVVDTNGCVAETNFSISETFPTSKFTASPLEGDVPLEVNFTNQSTGATDLIWYIANDTLYSTNPNYTFEEEGNFNVTLVAYDTYLHCSDTASVQIFATFPFTVIAPSLFVKQDAPYQIYTSNVATLQYELYNSIGQQLYNHTLQPTQGLNDIWYPYNISRGIYLYRITAQDDEGNEKVFSGKIVVI